MKKVFIFCMVLVFSFSLFAGFSIFSKQGTVSVSANMENVEVYVKGKKLAVIQDGAADIKLDEGDNIITLLKPIDKYSEYKAVKKVFVGADAVMRVKFELKVTLTKEGEAKQAKEDEDFISKDGIVYDKRLNLTWQDNYEAKSVKKNWKGAKEYCTNLNLAGFSDWRLPNIEELLSITDMYRFKPAIRKAFKNVENSFYWSSTSVASDSSYAWHVLFDYGGDLRGSKSYAYFVRCVR